MNFYGFSVKETEMMREIFYAAGSALVIRKSVIDEVGLFDEDYFIFQEDVDLSWRVRLAGYKIALIQKAVVYHRISATVKRLKADLMWHQRKNRVTSVIKNYEMQNMLKVLPVLVMVYLVVFIKEVGNRNTQIARTNLSSLAYNLTNLKKIWRKRLVIQRKTRRVSDKEILMFVLPSTYSWQCFIQSLKIGTWRGKTESRKPGVFFGEV